MLRAFQLDFQKTQNGKLTLTIQLKDVTGVSRSENAPSSFEIVRVAKPTGSGISPANRDVPQKSIICQVQGDDQIYEWIDSIYARCPGMGGVSNPTNFSHRVHVGFDPVNGSFVGLPSEWEKLLTASAITKDDYQRNPTAVLEVLEFYADISKRGQQPDVYSSLTPTPPVNSSQNMQLGYGGAGTAIAPPRQKAPAAMARQASYQNQLPYRSQQDQPSRSQNGTPVQGQRKASGPERMARYSPESDSPRQRDPNQDKLGMNTEMLQRMEEEARRVKELQEKRLAREEEKEQNRRDQEAYNTAIPKARTPLAKQELGGYGVSNPSPAADRFNPTRSPPPAPGVDRARQQPQGSLRQPTTQRPAPKSPNTVNGGASAVPRPPFVQKQPSYREQSPTESQSSLRTPTRPDLQQRQPSTGQPSPRQAPHAPERVPTQQERPSPNGQHVNGNGPSQPSTRLPAPVQTPAPLNVSTKQPAGMVTKVVTPEMKQNVEAPIVKKTGAESKKEARMSNMSESELMANLKAIVSKDNPELSYNKQKKIGQGASGSVYAARIKPDTPSPVARRILETQGSKAQVAIKQMDLSNQPRKELIINEIIVMRESRHPNIVNFLDSFLPDGNKELWVILEFMEGGALTDVIDNNPSITEPQIAAICNEVGIYNKEPVQQTCH